MNIAVSSIPRLYKFLPIATSLHIRSHTITGHTQEARHGMTQAEQEEVMESFRKGECNLLASAHVSD